MGAICNVPLTDIARTHLPHLQSWDPPTYTAHMVEIFLYRGCLAEGAEAGGQG